MTNQPQFNEADLEIYKQPKLDPNKSDNEVRRQQLEVLQQLRDADSMTQIFQILDTYHALRQRAMRK